MTTYITGGAGLIGSAGVRAVQLRAFDRSCGADRSRHTLRCVLRFTECTTDRHGQHLLVCDYELPAYLTALPAGAPVALYRADCRPEQFHSEIKTDLDFERLPSGKFTTNDLILLLAALAYNVSQLIGQNTSTREDAPPMEGLRTIVRLTAVTRHIALSRIPV